jgi:DNA segregation ATPase FtsK/SpoIIIE-like protein
LVEVNLQASPHALVMGSLEGGRSDLLAAWAASLAFRHSPRWLNLLLLDFGGAGVISALNQLPHMVRMPPTQLEDSSPSS